MSSMMLTSRLATATRSAVSSGEPMMTSPPTDLSFMTALMAVLKSWAAASPLMSMGLVIPASLGSPALRSAMVSGASLAASTYLAL